MKHFSSGIVRTPRLSGFVILDLTSKVCPINLLAGSNPPASHISLYFLCRWKTTGVFKILCVWFSVDCIFPACHSLVSSPASGVCAGWGDEGGWGDRRSSVLLGVCVCVCSWYHFWVMDDCKTSRSAYLWANDITNSLLNALPRQIGLSCSHSWLYPPKLNFILSLALAFSNLEKRADIWAQRGGRRGPKNRVW